MVFLWRHKFLSLTVISLFFYWFYNPEGSFGIARKGFVVYNRIPVAFFDLYVNFSGKIVIEGDLRKSEMSNTGMTNICPVKRIYTKVI